MSYGKMTKELEPLYEAYKKRWGDYPDTYENAEYAAEEYDDYVADIKRTLELDVEMPALYPHDEDEY